MTRKVALSWSAAWECFIKKKRRKFTTHLFCTKKRNNGYTDDESQNKLDRPVRTRAKSRHSNHVQGDQESFTQLPMPSRQGSSWFKIDVYSSRSLDQPTACTVLTKQDSSEHDNVNLLAGIGTTPLLMTLVGCSSHTVYLFSGIAPSVRADNVKLLRRVLLP